MSGLSELLAAHLAEPFPSSVKKGINYGSVDPVMIGSDIYGWTVLATTGELADSGQLRRARVDLAESGSEMPADAQPYYERLIRMADLALEAVAK